jgi:hypothetical protein
MKNLIKLKWLLLVLGAFIFENNMNAQGCVAVRATGLFRNHKQFYAFKKPIGIQH